MSSTFESVLSQAETLSKEERAKLVSVLSESFSKRRKPAKPRTKNAVAKNGEQDAIVLAKLRAWVDEIESSPDPKRRVSARIAERIRNKNDRGYTL